VTEALRKMLIGADFFCGKDDFWRKLRGCWRGKRKDWGNTRIVCVLFLIHRVKKQPISFKPFKRLVHSLQTFWLKTNKCLVLCCSICSLYLSHISHLPSEFYLKGTQCNIMDI
jgi:hypothetical protein